MSVQSMGGMGKYFQTFSNLFLKTSTEGAVTTEGGSLQSPPKMPTISFGGDLNLRLLCRGVVVCSVEREGEQNQFGSVFKRPLARSISFSVVAIFRMCRI